MRKLRLLVLFVVVVTKALAQNITPNLPSIISPAPEASAIAKNGQLTVGLFTGAAQTSIPLYDIKVGKFTLPLVLNYATNGFKVDEIPSRVGLGWTLNAGGVVTRTVRDAPDDQSIREIIPATFPSDDTPSLRVLSNKFNTLEPGPNQIDEEADEFNVYAPGMSIKFILDNNRNPIQIPYSNNKIEVIGNGVFDEFVITNTEGVKYRFGGLNAVEVSRSHFYVNPNVTTLVNIATAFYLRKIELPNGDSLVFHYTPISISAKTGVTQTLSKKEADPGDVVQCYNGCGTPCEANNNITFNETVQSSSFSTSYLTGITTSNAITINFGYENRPDNSGDNRLTSIVINPGAYQKKYFLTYADPETSGHSSYSSMYNYNKRFFLKELKTLVPGSSAADTLRYLFDYANMDGLPHRLSYCQDHYGYYNGANNQNLLPETYTSFNSYPAANREPNSSYAKQGLLTKVTYPTGGYETFAYEAPKFTVWEKLNTFIGCSVAGEGQSISASVTYSDTSIYTKRAHVAKLYFSASPYPECGGCVPPEEGIDRIAQVKVFNLTTGATTPIFYKELRTYTDIALEVNLEANTHYMLELKTFGAASVGEADLVYDTASKDYFIPVLKDGSSIVVSKIESFNVATNKTVKKFFKYSEPELWTDKNYFSQSNIRNQCPLNCAGSTDCMRCFTDCHYIYLSSQSSAPLYLFNGNVYAYKTVIESDDESFANGGVEHHFELDGMYAGEDLVGEPNSFLPSNTTSSTVGYEVRTRYFNKDSLTLKELFNYYHLDTAVNIYHVNYAVKVKYTGVVGFLTQTPTPWADVYDMFNISRYTYISNWIQLDSTVSVEYDAQNHVIRNKTAFYYGTPDNILPIKTTSITSGGQIVSIENKYPQDYSGTEPYDKMVANNIISLPIEAVTRKSGVQLTRLRTEYSDWYPNSSNGTIHIYPKKIYVQRGTQSEEVQVQYYVYDTKGNILEVAKEKNVKHTYLWGYHNTYPVAEIIGEEYSSIINSSALDTALIQRPTNDQALRSELNKIRQAFPHAQMTTYTYEPLVGMTSQTDINNNTTYYEYDGFGRLVHIRDKDGNILKKFCYNYQGQAEECQAYTGPIWESSGETACMAVACSQNSSYTVNLQHHKEVDKNPLSAGYNTAFRWVSDNVPGSCVTPADWQPTGNYSCEVVNGVNTGGKILEEKDMNPCSPSYGTTRSGGTVQDCATCPKPQNWVVTSATCEKDAWGKTTGNKIVVEQNTEPCSVEPGSTRSSVVYDAAACPPTACTTTNCTGANKKCVRGVCETGVKVYTDSVEKIDGSYRCTYHYEWSDGSWSGNYSETRPAGYPCPGF